MLIFNFINNTPTENLWKDYQSIIGVILTIIGMIFVDERNKKRWMKDSLFKQKISLTLNFANKFLEESPKLLSFLASLERYILFKKEPNSNYIGFPLPEDSLSYFKTTIDKNQEMLDIYKKIKLYIGKFKELNHINIDILNSFLNQTSIFYSRLEEQILNGGIIITPANLAGIKENLYCLKDSMSYFIQDLSFAITPFILSYGYLYNEIEKDIDPNIILNQELSSEVLDKALVLIEKCRNEIKTTNDMLNNWLKS